MSDTAADVIYRALSGSFGDFNGNHADRAIAALAAAGYEVILAPDADKVVGVLAGWSSDDVWAADGLVADGPDELLPDEARRRAAALLAAARHAEAAQ